MNELNATPHAELLAELMNPNTKPNYNITFHNGGKQVGTLDFNGPEMVFEGDAAESAKMFFDFIARSFKARLEHERADEREACAQVCDWMAQRTQDIRSAALESAAENIRARSNT